MGRIAPTPSRRDEATSRPATHCSCWPDPYRSTLREALPVDRVTAPLSAETAALLAQVWGNVLARVRYPDKDFEVVDGTTYYVGQWQKGGGFRAQDRVKVADCPAI
ncbi:MAG TPA: hypothetical protein VFQ34_13220 [Nitrospiraceae bacterium]|nr:hypothetical protein [Nitrospiraceae bacterium]